MASTDPVNRLEVRLVGMSRSGNHALVNWMLAQASGRACFLNCAEPGTNPFVSARALDNGAVYRANYPDFDIERERQGHFTSKDLLIYSHEDCFLGYLRKADDPHQLDAWLGPSRRRVDVLLLRDPCNLFASRLKTGTSGSGHGTALRIWKQHAREFLGLRRMLRPDRLAVSYNRWIGDRSYRRDLAEALGLTFSDAGRQDVPPVGAGSSFDGRLYHGRAADMEVTERWRWLEHSSRLTELFDSETLDLGERIFGRVCSEEFHERVRGARAARSSGSDARSAAPGDPPAAQ